MFALFGFWAASSAAAAANKAKVAAEENLAKTVKPKAAAEAPKVGPEPLPVNKSLVAVTDDFARAPSAATEGAFKAALKSTTDPKSILSALKSAKDAYVAFDQSATKVLSKILGSKLVRWGGLALIVAIETWQGWEDYVLVWEAYEKGYISMAMKNTLVRNIIAIHGVSLVAAYLFGELGAMIGAAIGAPALGLGAIVGGILGAILLGTAGAMAATYFVEILLGNKTFSDYFSDVLEAFGAGDYGDASATDAKVTKPQAQVTPATSIVPSAAAAPIEPEQQVAQAPQTVAEPVETPQAFRVPERQVLAGIVPSPVNIETPSLEPPDTSAASNLDPNAVRDNISSQLAASDRQRMQPGSDTTVPNYGGPQQSTPTGSENKEMTTLRTSSGLSYQVNKSFASNFDGFVKALESTGYQIKSIGGYADRNIKDSNKKSFHSVGAAIDINPKQNPVTYGNIITDLPEGVAGLAAQFGLGWGGSWSGKKKDTMHFSAASAERGAFRIDRNTGAIMAAQGGKIHPQEGGTLTLVAEAGEPEYIVPQSKVENFAHEMLAARPTSRNKTKKHTHVMVVPIYT